MPRPFVALLALLGVFCTGTLPVHAQQPDPTPPPPQAPSAHVAFVDGVATIERDGEVDSVESGIPLADGDRLETTSGRLELLFEDGSTLYVDEFSRLDVLSGRFLRLVAGRLTFEVSNSGAVPSTVLYELDTPAASVALSSPGEYRIVAQEDRFRGAGAGAVEPTITTVEVVRGTVTLTSDVGRTDLRAGEQSVVRNGEPPGFPVRFNSAQWTPFGHWVELRRSERRNVSASRPYLPQDVQAYASEFDRNGTWGVEPEVGTVWYPTVGGGWRPYYNGRWSWIQKYGWTWVGYDAWSWPTHHYGRWGLNTRGSWYWIPGRQWSPAAVSWAVGSSFVSWCPLGFNGQPVVGFSNGPSYVYNRAFDPDFAWTTIPGHAFGTPVVAGRIAFAGSRWVDQHREPYVLQHYAPRGRGGNRLTSRRGGPEFTSRRPGTEQGPRRNRGGPEGNRPDVPGRNQPSVTPPTRYAVPRSTLGMPATSLPPGGERPDTARPRVMTPRGVFTPAPVPSPQTGSPSPFPAMPGPGGLPQTRYGIPPSLPPLVPSVPSPPSNTATAGTPREAPRAASGDQSSSGRTAVPRAQSGSGSESGSGSGSGSGSTQSRRSSGASGTNSGGSGSGSVRTRSR